MYVISAGGGTLSCLLARLSYVRNALGRATGGSGRYIRERRPAHSTCPSRLGILESCRAMVGLLIIGDVSLRFGRASAVCAGHTFSGAERWWRGGRVSGACGRSSGSVMMLCGWKVSELSELKVLRAPRYDRGDKYCPTCAVAFRDYAGRLCPWCHRTLRVGVRGRRHEDDRVG